MGFDDVRSVGGGNCIFLQALLFSVLLLHLICDRNTGQVSLFESKGGKNIGSPLCCLTSKPHVLQQ